MSRISVEDATDEESNGRVALATDDDERRTKDDTRSGL
jgi:hypothetical protein